MPKMHLTDVRDLLNICTHLNRKPALYIDFQIIEQKNTKFELYSLK